MWAAAGNNAAAIEALVEAGADVQARTKYRTVPLFQTGGFGRRAERNSDVTKQSGFQALHFAVRAGALDAVKALLKSGATIRDTTGDGTGVLVMAIASAHFELADFLLEQGADPNAQRAGLDAAASDRLHAPAEHRRQQPGPRPARHARQSDNGPQVDCPRRRPQPRGHEKPRRHQRRTKTADRGGRHALLGRGADRRPALHAVARRARRRSAAREQDRRHATARGLGARHRKTG